MKNLKIILLVLFLAGCSDDFINNSPISNANVENFFNTQADFESAITAAYQTLRMSGVYNDGMQAVAELRSDNAEMGTTASNRFHYADMANFRMPTSSPITTSIWDHHYVGINRVNTIIARNESADINASAKIRNEAESRFLRGLFYFNLVRVFGDVPLVTKPITTIEEAYEYGRTPLAEVYEQIFEDLKFAWENLPATVPSSQSGRATRYAAAGLLGKAYLTQRNFEGAKEMLGYVIASENYELLNDYDDLWNASNKNHKESIFDVQFSRSGTFSSGSNFTVRYTPYLYPHLPFYSTAGGHNIPTENLLEAFGEDDLRSNSFRDSYLDDNGDVVDGLSGRYSVKFYDMPVQGQGDDNNWPVLRYADVLLMYAEAENELGFSASGDAFTYLNMVRERAGLPDLSVGNPVPELSVNNQQEFRLAVENERRLELAMEGHRWFDLVRTGRAIEVLGPVSGGQIQPHHLVLPVPQSQIDINPRLTQNPNY